MNDQRVSHNKLGFQHCKAFLFSLVRWANEHPCLFAAVLFMMSFLFRLLCNFLNGPVLITIYPDELRYLHISRSLAEQGQLLIRGVPTDFQKILYPLFISPAFMVTKDALLQTTLIRIINCLLLSSAVFPVALLTKKLTPNKVVFFVSLFVTVTLPDMSFDITLMSEVLYFPLAAWVFFLFVCAAHEPVRVKQLFLCALYGFVLYLAYLTKEISLAFLLATGLFFVVDSIRDRKKLLQNSLCLSVCAFTFFAPFFVMKMTIFGGLGNSYNQMSLSALNSSYVYVYLLYSAVLILVATVLSFYIFPVLIPLYAFSAMNEKNRNMYLFAIFSLVIIVGTIAYSISIREDLPEPIPRLHLRYIAPLVIPFLIQCFDILLAGSGKKSKIVPSFFIVFTLYGILLLFLLPYGAYDHIVCDHFTLRISDFLGWVVAKGAAREITFNIAWAIAKWIALAFAVFCTFLLIKQKGKSALLFLLCYILAVNAVDNFLGYVVYSDAKTIYAPEFIGNKANVRTSGFLGLLRVFLPNEQKRLTHEAINSLIAIDQYTANLDGTKIVFFKGTNGIYADTYLRAYPVRRDELMELSEKSDYCVTLNSQPIPEAFGNRTTRQPDLDTINYIIVREDDNPFTNVKPIYECSPFIVLQNLDPGKLYTKPALEPD